MASRLFLLVLTAINVCMNKRGVLIVIVLAQFCGTSLWFAGNAILEDLVATFNLGEDIMKHLTASVQLGFILGTLSFAVLAVADRFSPSKVFLFSGLLAAAANLFTVWTGNSVFSLLLIRFTVGFFLAGIYPVGMKIAADYFQKGLGTSLGYLVGALTLGTAFPHFIKSFSIGFDWQWVVFATSIIASLGALAIGFLIPDGPFRKANLKVDFRGFLEVFKNQNFRSSAIGYFGHMWELYTFWAFVPIILFQYNSIHSSSPIESIPLWSFLIIGVGAISCIVGGYVSKEKGVKNTASVFLFLSMLCCFLSPLMFFLSPAWFLTFLVFWGLMVIADSPLFSTLVAQNAPVQNRGAALTLVNSIGFAITIISIQLVGYLTDFLSYQYVYVFLGLGPLIGLGVLFVKTKH